MGLFDKGKKAEVGSGLYAGVSSKEKIAEMVEAGELKPVYLMPIIFNGQESEKNTIYAPSFIVDIKEKSDYMIEELLMKNIINNYSCKPTYNEGSLVPTSMLITAKKNGNVVIQQKVNIW